MIGFIGAGNMAFSICSGMISMGAAKPDDVIASAPTTNNLDKFKNMGCRITHDNREVVRMSDIVLLCVKPFKVSEVMGDLKKNLVWDSRHLIISVVSGIRMKQLEQLADNCRIIRVIPNTPIQVQAGVLGYCLNSACSEKDEITMQNLFGKIALCRKVSEDQLNAVTGVAGSAPAFVYTVIQALSDGGVKMGLPRSLATEMAAQTVMGAGKMVLETGSHPDVLRDAVCSPAGTTISGVHALERAGVRSAFMDAVEAATNKAIAQGEEKK